MTKRLRYQVATSLDGFIATPNGGYDWLVMDPAIDFTALYAEFDAAVMGRKTYDVAKSQGMSVAMPGMDVVVFSRSLAPVKSKGFRIVNEDPAKVVLDLLVDVEQDLKARLEAVRAAQTRILCAAAYVHGVSFPA